MIVGSATARWSTKSASSAMHVRRLQAVVPFPGAARQVFGAEPVVGAVEPSLDVGKQDMDDRHEPLGVLAFALDDGVVPICLTTVVG